MLARWKWIGAIIGVLLVVARFGNSIDTTDYKPLKAKADAAVAAIPIKALWQSLKPDSTAEKNYSYNLDYRAEPSPDEAKTDATAVAYEVVKAIKQAGMNRVLTDAPVAVYTGRDIEPASPTNGSRVKSCGYAAYDPDTDEITWQAPQP